MDSVYDVDSRTGLGPMRMAGWPIDLLTGVPCGQRHFLPYCEWQPDAVKIRDYVCMIWSCFIFSFPGLRTVTEGPPPGAVDDHPSTRPIIRPSALVHRERNCMHLPKATRRMVVSAMKSMLGVVDGWQMRDSTDCIHSASIQWVRCPILMLQCCTGERDEPRGERNE